MWTEINNWGGSRFPEKWAVPLIAPPRSNYYDTESTYAKSIPTLSCISLHTLKKNRKTQFCYGKKNSLRNFGLFSKYFFRLYKNTLFMPKGKQPQEQIENINTLFENINNVLNLVPRRIRVPHPKHRKYEQIQVVTPSQLPCYLTYLPSPRTKLKKKRHRISSPSDETKSNDSKSNRAKKKLKNQLTSQPHSPCNTPKNSQTSQCDQSQKKQQKRDNYEKKKTSKMHKPLTTNPLERPNTFGKIYLDTENLRTQVLLLPISTTLTQEENFRMKNYTKNPRLYNFRKHDYIDPSSSYMYRCPLITCKYAIINPQDIDTSIKEHCQHFHLNNSITFQVANYYKKNTCRQIDYSRPDFSLQ